jgi:hypothetical protein
MKRKATPYFTVGQRVVCVDAEPHWPRRAGSLTRGGIYTIRAIDQRPGWQAPGWGVFLEGIRVISPDDGTEWPMNPTRFRPVIDRPRRTQEELLAEADACRQLLAVDIEITRLVFAAMMPGLTQDQVRAIKRKERTARQDKRRLCSVIRASIRGTPIPG